MSTMLENVKEFCRGRGLPVPASVQSSTDPQVMQILGLLNKLPIDLLTRRAWQQVKVEVVHTSLASEDQGDLDDLCPLGFMGIIKDTMYDRSTSLQIVGGADAAYWQQAKGTASTGPFHKYRLRGHRLLFTPALPAGHTIVWEYFSSYFVHDENDQPKSRFTLDTDHLRFPDSVVQTWLDWRWLAAKKFDYAEEFAQYERVIATLSHRDESPQPANASKQCSGPQSGIIVPIGNWNL